MKSLHASLRMENSLMAHSSFFVLYTSKPNLLKASFIPSACSRAAWASAMALRVLIPASTAAASQVLRVCFRLQLWVANVVKMWLRHVVVNVVSSYGCEFVKMRSPQVASKNVVTRHGKKCCECHAQKLPQQCETDCCEKIMDCSLFLGGSFLPSENGRRSVTSCPPTLVFAQDAKRNSRTTFTTTCGNIFATSFPVL